MLPPPILVLKALGWALAVYVGCGLAAWLLALVVGLMSDLLINADPVLAYYGCAFVGGCFAGCLGYYGAGSALSPQGDAWPDRPHARIVGRWTLAGVLLLYGALAALSLALAAHTDAFAMMLAFHIPILLAAVFMHATLAGERKG
jgi:hypothetical protein